MSPYLLTITFLTLMSILTSSEVVRFAESSLINRMSESHTKDHLLKEEFLAISHIETFRKKKIETEDDPLPKNETKKDKKRAAKRSPALRFNFSRPPNNSRLNLYLLLHDESHKTFLYDVAAQLIRRLYADADFFHEIGNFEYRLLDALLEKKDETKDFCFPDDLSRISFDDTALQHAFYQMMRGSKDYPSLLNYVTFDKANGNRQKINLMFASQELLEAVLKNPQLTAQVFEVRERFWQEILEQEAHRHELEKCKNRTTFRDELEASLKKIFGEDEFKLFDITLGKFGNILLIEDPETGIVLREKYQRQKSSDQSKIGIS